MSRSISAVQMVNRILHLALGGHTHRERDGQEILGQEKTQDDDKAKNGGRNLALTKLLVNLSPKSWVNEKEVQSGLVQTGADSGIRVWVLKVYLLNVAALYEVHSVSYVP